MIVATVKCVIGNRKLCEFVSRCDLGISGFGFEHFINILYDANQEVDVKRVEEAMSEAALMSKIEEGEFVILSYEVLEIKTVHYDGKEEE